MDGAVIGESAFVAAMASSAPASSCARSLVAGLRRSCCDADRGGARLEDLGDGEYHELTRRSLASLVEACR